MPENNSNMVLVSLRLPTELLAKVDVIAARAAKRAGVGVHVDRSQVLRQLLELGLKRQEGSGK